MLDELADKTLLAYKNGATVLHRFTNEADNFLSIGLHKCNPGSWRSSIWIVCGAPIRHFHENRNEIESFFSQDILIFALVFLRGSFEQNALLFELSKSTGEDISCHSFF